MHAWARYIATWFWYQWKRLFPNDMGSENLECFILSYRPEQLPSAANCTDRARELHGGWRLPTIAELFAVASSLKERIQGGEIDCENAECAFFWAFDMRRSEFVGCCPFRGEHADASIVLPPANVRSYAEIFDADESEGGWEKPRDSGEHYTFYAVAVRELPPHRGPVRP